MKHPVAGRTGGETQDAWAAGAKRAAMLCLGIVALAMSIDHWRSQPASSEQLAQASTCASARIARSLAIPQAVPLRRKDVDRIEQDCQSLARQVHARLEQQPVVDAQRAALGVAPR